MEALAVGACWETEQWRNALEDLDDTWRCAMAASPEAALARLEERDTDVLILCQTDEALLSGLSRLPVCAVPWVFGDGFGHGSLDGCCALHQASELPGMLERLMHSGLPRLAYAKMQPLTELADELLHALDMPNRLGARIFLPELAAMCTVQPSLLGDMTGRLYPLIGQRYGLSACCVERRLRSAVESTWSRSSLDALERFFGQTVDPQRGKPTNREFLAGLRICLLRSAQYQAAGRQSSIQSIYRP